MYFWKENFIVDVWKDTFLFTILIYSDQSIFFKDPMCNSYYFNGGGGGGGWRGENGGGGGGGGGGRWQVRNGGGRGEVSPALSVKSAPILQKMPWLCPCLSFKSV